MSIFNAISVGGETPVEVVVNTAKNTSTYTLQFPVTHEPKEWFVCTQSNVLTDSASAIPTLCYIGRKNDTYIAWGLLSQNYYGAIADSSRVTSSYSNGVFSVTTSYQMPLSPSDNKYILIYI